MRAAFAKADAAFLMLVLFASTCRLAYNVCKEVGKVLKKAFTRTSKSKTVCNFPTTFN